MSTANDDFNRADESPPSGWSGVGIANWGVVSNKLRNTAGGDTFAVRNLAVATDDVDTSVDWTTNGDSNPTVLWSRVSIGGAVDYNDVSAYYLLVTNSGSSGWISSWVTGSDVQLVTATGIPALSNGETHKLRMTCIGNVITGYVDATQIAQVTNSTVPTGKYSGLESVTTNLAFDNFLHGDYSAGGTIDRILMEDGFSILQEDGMSGILGENGTPWRLAPTRIVRQAVSRGAVR